MCIVFVDFMSLFLLAVGVVCRPAVGECDIEEVCWNFKLLLLLLINIFF